MFAPAQLDNNTQALAGTRASKARLQFLLATIILASLLVALLWVRLVVMVRLWVSDGTYSLFAVVPLVSLAIAYAKLKCSTAPAGEGSRAGLVVTGLVVAATALLDVSGAGFNSLTPFLVALMAGGIVLGLYGMAMLRTLACPLAFLLLLVPLPPALLAGIDFPLQETCARVTVFIVNLAGFHLQRAGTMILLGPSGLVANVAPACNGVRSSLAMLFIAMVYAYLLTGSWQRKIVLLIAAVPLAYLGNFIRLLGDVCAVASLGQGFLKYEQAWDYITGFLIFLLPIALLFHLAKLLGCGEFRQVRGQASASHQPVVAGNRRAPSYAVLALILLSGIAAQRFLKPKSGDESPVLGSEALEAFPYKIGEYSGKDASTSDCAAARSAYGETGVVCREYSNQNGDPLEVYIVPTTVGVHSPDYCLRASGWVITNRRSGSASGRRKFTEITAFSPSSNLAVCSYYWRTKAELIGDDNPIQQWLRHVSALFKRRSQNGLLVEVCGQPMNELETATTSARVTKFTAEVDPAVAQLFVQQRAPWARPKPSAPAELSLSRGTQPPGGKGMTTWARLRAKRSRPSFPRPKRQAGLPAQSSPSAEWNPGGSSPDRG
jgi:exosortase J